MSRCRHARLTRFACIPNLLLLLLVFLGISPTLSRAATFNIANGDIAALKNAITTANGTPEVDTIELAANATYILTVIDNGTEDEANGLPVISEPLILNGNGATLMRSTAGGTAEFRILEIDTSRSPTTLNNVTIANGRSMGDGGGVLNTELLNVNGCAFTDNVAAGSGGAIRGDFNSDNLLVRDSTFTNNTAVSDRDDDGGGAISFQGGDDNILTGCTFMGNSGPNGGAVQTTFFSDFAAPIANCAFTGNSSTTNADSDAIALGGALYNESDVDLNVCTFTGNTVTGNGAQGGAVYNEDTLDITNCTFSTNSAPNGGAFYHDGFETTITDTTFTTNTATTRGGAIFGAGDMSVTNSMFTGNSSGANGGAIENQSALTLLACIFNDNTLTAQSGSGGAIHNQDFNTRVTLTATNCAFNRSAAFTGGAISSGQGFLQLSNCSFTGSTAASGAGISLDSNGNGLLVNCTFTNNNANIPNVNTSGGGIFNNGTLTLRVCTFTTNSASTGGGLYNGSGVNNFVPSATVQNCIFDGNSASGSNFPLGQGGGIFNFGRLTVTGSTIKNNSAPLRGGGIASSSTGTLNLFESTLNGNSVTSTANATNFGFGGGVFINSIRANTIINCTFSGNTATNRGGGLFADVNTSAPGTLTLTNSTFTLNSVSGTDATAGGGGLFTGTGVTTQIGNTLVAANTAATGPDVRGPVTSLGYNFIGDATAATGFTATGDQTGTPAAPLNANLGPLANNGGPTLTHLPQSGSPAIDGGKQPATGATINDQRAFTRPVNQPGVTDAAGGDGSDIGALEIQVADTPQNGALVVNKTLDTFDGICGADDCSLRDAIFVSNALTSADVITFATGLSGTIALTRALPNLADDGEIRGPGAGILTVRRESGGDYRIFTIPGGNTVTISGLTLSNGLANGLRFPEDSGGGIFNDGALTLTDCVISGNNATGGGSVAERTSGGGGIFNGGTLTMNGGTLSSNSFNGSVNVNANGGGLLNLGTASLNAVTVSGNSATAALNGRNPRGGGLFNQLGATLTVSASTISGNSVMAPNAGTGKFGGGIETFGTLLLINSTLSGNTATNGGGLSVERTGTTVLNSTITRNNGSFNAGVSGDFTVGNTIIAGNVISRSDGEPDVSSDVVSRGYNLIGNRIGSTGFFATGDQSGSAVAPLNPQLGDLQDNGGPTLTHAPGSGSPAIDKGKDLAGLGVDQRGMPRPLGVPQATGGDGSDIGAYETPGVVPTPRLSINNAAAVAEGNSGQANAAHSPSHWLRLRAAKCAFPIKL